MPTGVDPVPMGTLVIDCSALAGYLEDAPPGELAGKQSSQEGFREAALEVISNQAEYGVHVGITASDITKLQEANERVATIDAFLPAARKLVEMLEETRHLIDHRRHLHLYELAAIIDARSARSSPELLARYEMTREYRSAIANRAVATRRRNAQIAEQPDGEPIVIPPLDLPEAVEPDPQPQE